MSALASQAGEPAVRSVFLDALGATAAQLHPEVLRYAAGPGETGGVGVAEGVFETVRSRFGRLQTLVRPVLGAQLLLGASGRDVPFFAVFTSERAATPMLRTERRVDFDRGIRVFVDTLLPGREPGTLLNRLGAAGRLEAELECTVTSTGGFALRSSGMALRLGRRRIRLPRLLGLDVRSENGYDELVQRQTITAQAVHPILGTVLEYRGSFDYRPA